MKRSIPPSILIGGVLLLILMLGNSTANASVYASRTYGRGYVHDKSTTQWDAVHATMEVNSGRVDQPDLGNLGFVGEVLWAANQSWSGYIESGYRRGWNGSNVLTAYWENHLPNGNDYRHQVTYVDIAVGENDQFEMVHATGTAWRFYVKGYPAKDVDGDYTADTTWGSSCQWAIAGLEGNCDLGALGSSGDHVGITGIQVAPVGDTWIYGPADFSHQMVTQLPGTTYVTHAGWTTQGHSVWNYRNN